MPNFKLPYLKKTGISILSISSLRFFLFGILRHVDCLLLMKKKTWLAMVATGNRQAITKRFIPPTSIA
jgi:hypothetical protein